VSRPIYHSQTEAVKGLTPPELLKKLAGEGCSIPVVEDWQGREIAGWLEPLFTPNGTAVLHSE